MKKILSLLLVLITAVIPVNAATLNNWIKDTAKLENNLNVTTYSVKSCWDDNMKELDMPFRPFDKQVVMQNPPDFSWKYVDGAESYNIRISTNTSMTDIIYKKTGVLKNILNPETAFNEGTYYWQVQYVKDGTTSDWSNVRRFRIDEDNVKFLVDDIDTMLSKIPDNHPRVYINENNRNEILKNKYYVSELKRVVDLKKNDANFVSEDAILKEKVDAGGSIDMVYGNVTDICMKAAIYFQLTKDEDIAEFALKLISDISQWDYTNGYTSYANQDQTFRRTALIGAICYDMMFDYLSKKENQAVKEELTNMIKWRSEFLYNTLFEKTSIYKSPYAGHGDAAYKFLGIISIAMYHELDGAETWLKEILPVFINTYPLVSSGEDGGTFQGTGYWRYTTIYGKLLADALDMLGMIDLYKKPAAKNEFEYAMYMYPNGSVGAFGDQSYEPVGVYHAQSMGELYRKYQDPEIAWFINEVDSVPALNEPNSMHMFIPIDAKTKPPHTRKNGHLFKETGVAAMHSQLENPKRISLFFRSSKSGAYNHAHPDQNSFIIQAFGEQLAIDSGYYDSYYSEHDKNYSRRTYAHNAITFGGGIGQEYNRNNNGEENLKLKGNIEGFVTTPYFDSVTGNAKKSYNGNLDKAKRSIIYLRPDVFIIADDLKYKNDEKTTFEFFLNGYENVALTGNNTAKIVKGDAELYANVIYPSVTGNYSNKFAGPDGIEYMPSGSFAERQVHQRVWFTTQMVNNTKMVTLLNVNKKGEQLKNVTTETKDTYIKLTSEDESEVYVNLTDDKVEIPGGISFKGTALTKNENNLLLTDGTYLEENGKQIISSDKNITAFINDEKLLVSADNDVKVSLGDFLVNLAYENFKEIPLNTYKNGIKLTKVDGGVKLSLDKGEYEFNINNIPCDINESDIRIWDALFTKVGNVLSYSINVERTKDFNKKSDYKIYLCAYNGEELVKVSEKPFEIKADELRKEITATLELPQEEKDLSYKAFVWKDNLSPQVNSGIYNSNSVEIEKILIDNEKLSDFNNQKNTYDYTYGYYKECMPKIKVIPKNSASKVEIKNISAYPQTAEIKITSQDGTIEKTVYINFDIGLNLKTKKVYSSVCAEGYTNYLYRTYAFGRWRSRPGDKVDTGDTFSDNNGLSLRKMELASHTPYLKFDLSDMGIDLSKVKSVKLYLNMYECYAIKEGESYTDKDGQKIADSTFEEIKVAPNLVYEADWDTVYKEDVNGKNYPQYTKYPVGSSMAVPKLEDRKIVSELDIGLIKNYILKNKSLSFAICIQNNPKMIGASDDVYYGNYAYIRYKDESKPYLEIEYYEE